MFTVLNQKIISEKPCYFFHYPYFDNIPNNINQASAPSEAINLIFDATFFSRTDGVLTFRANKKNILWKFICSETIHTIGECLEELKTKGFQFKSFTIDGRRGVIQLLESIFPGIPIQLCHFHQAQIIRRYTTCQPKTSCGKELKKLMSQLTLLDEEAFSEKYFTLHEKYKEFLKEKNENKQYVHRRLRSAFRSLKSNLPYLFAYKKYPNLGIPNTTNTCDGSFAHWKQKLKIHRGLKKHRRNKMVNYLLK